MAGTDVGGTGDGILHRIRVAGKDRTAETYSDHFPQVVPIHQVSVLVDRLGFEQKCAWGKEVFLVASARRENLLARVISDMYLEPTLDKVQRSGGIIVAHLVRDHNDANWNRLTLGNALRRI